MTGLLRHNVPCFGFGYSPLNAITDTQILFQKIENAGIELDSVICNAADLGRWMNPLTVDPIAWQNVILTNVVGYFMPARYAVNQMIRTGRANGATIVFVGSINYKDALPERSGYVTSKGAIASMTKALALDFAQYGVRVNCLAPGAIWTTRYEDEYDAAEVESRKSKIPLKAFSTKETMGNNAYFLATEDKDSPFLRISSISTRLRKNISHFLELPTGRPSTTPSILLAARASFVR